MNFYSNISILSYVFNITSSRKFIYFFFCSILFVHLLHTICHSSFLSYLSIPFRPLNFSMPFYHMWVACLFDFLWRKQKHEKEHEKEHEYLLWIYHFTVHIEIISLKIKTLWSLQWANTEQSNNKSNRYFYLIRILNWNLNYGSHFKKYITNLKWFFRFLWSCSHVYVMDDITFFFCFKFIFIVFFCQSKEIFYIFNIIIINVKEMIKLQVFFYLLKYLNLSRFTVKSTIFRKHD